jgi:hypothetical protein
VGREANREEEGFDGDRKAAPTTSGKELAAYAGIDICRRRIGLDLNQHPWRTSQARHRDRPDQRRQVYGAAEGTSLAGVEDVPSQPCGWHCRDGSLCRADNLVPTALWVVDHGPWPPAYAERLIGSIRREWLDHIVVFGERHLRHVLLSYMDYYNGTRTYLSLNKDAPISRAVETAGRILGCPILGGLHHQYGTI